MGLIGFLLTLPISGPINGLIFVAEKLREQALEEMLDESQIQQQLLELEFRLDMGEIEAEEHAAREETLLEQLEGIREYREQHPE